MKKANYLLILILLLGMGCDEVIDITPDQDGTVTEPENADELEAVLRGAYAGLAKSENYGADFLLLGELAVGWLSGETFWNKPSRPLDAIAFSRISPNNAAVERIWEQSYRTINAANLVLRRAELAGSEQARVAGEARALRALVYFELLSYFSPPDDETLGVPLVLETITDNFPARASRTAVYQQIVSDLDFARQNLPEWTGNPYRFSGLAATALLARVELQRQNRATAQALAETVLGSGQFALSDQVRPVFLERENSELIFGLDRRGGTSEGVAARYTDDVEVLRPHLERYPEGDRRLSFFDATGATWRCNKWQQAADFLPMIRLSELILIRAEARLRSGERPSADLNALRARAGVPAFLPADITEATLWEERRRELAYEGHYLRDVRRWQRNPGNVPFNAPALVLPIPQREINSNPNLIQNEGY